MMSELCVPIQIFLPHYGTDKDGFRTVSDEFIACVRAKKEDKSITEKWKNHALLKDAECIFTFRRIPGVTVSRDMVIVCYDGRYNILSAENVRQRNMYIQVTARPEGRENDGSYETGSSG